MAENTKIEWCDHTFNPWEGCQKAGPGCDHCYAEARNARFGGGVAINWGPGAPRRRTSEANWGLPLKWDKLSEQWVRNGGQRARVFCASLADVFDNAVDPAWLVDLLDLIRNTPNLDWLLLTKRIGIWRKRLEEARDATLNSAFIECWLRGMAPPNVWIGATVVDQAEADRDIPKLLAVPARGRFLSIEPMLGPIDLRPWLPVMVPLDAPRLPCRVSPALDWIICGGESGPGARPMHPGWARSLRDQCAAAGVPFLFKQWGEYLPVGQVRPPESELIVPRSGYAWNCGTTAWRVGKKAAGRLLDGRTHDGFPEQEKT